MSVPLAGTEDHPQARIVPGRGAWTAGPSHAYLFHGPAGTGKRDRGAGLRGRAARRGRSPTRTRVRLRVEHGTHPDLTWVAAERRRT